MIRSAVLPAVQALLQTIPGIPTVVIDDFSRKAEESMDTALATGHCIALKPLLGSKLVAQNGTRVSERVNLTIHTRINPNLIVAGFSTYDLQDSIQKKLCGDLALQAKAGTTEGDVTALVPEDVGLHTDSLFFNVPITNS